MSTSALRHTRRRLTRGVAVTTAAVAGLAGLAVNAGPASADPSAIITDAGCAGSSLAANDDSSSSAVTLPFTINFFGTNRSSLFVNNNGNVTFNSALATFTPFQIGSSTPPILAAFFADVDTRGSGSGLATWGTTTYNGRPAFCVNWRDVGYFSQHTDKTDDFQLLLVDRSDVGVAGDFDLIYNYGRITWETGNSTGTGGTSAGVGFSAGDGDAGHFYDKPGSRVPGSFLDSNSSTGLANTSTDSTVIGRHVYEFRGGRAVGITPPDTTITSGPSGPTSSTSPTFTYTAAPGASTNTLPAAWPSAATPAARSRPAILMGIPSPPPWRTVGTPSPSKPPTAAA